MKNTKIKAKILAILAVSFAVFAMTFFAMAQNKNNGNLFLDSDQDGLTDQEEKMIGTDPFKTDTDGDGYSDGKEIKSGYDPLKAAPGDKLFAPIQTVTTTQNDQANNSTNAPNTDSSATNQETGTPPANALGSQLDSASLTDSQNDILAANTATDLSSDPNNPNLTNEMIGQLMQLTSDKISTDSSFAANPTYSAEDYIQIAQKSLQTVNVVKDLPEIQDSEIKVLPAVDDKKLDEEETRAKQKSEIEKYLAQVAFVFASNSPFPVQETDNLQSNISSEGTRIISALSTGDKTVIESYAQKAQAGIDQVEKIEVPYVLKDIHKSLLQLSIYTLRLKDEMSLASTDPMKSLAAASTLQSVAEKANQMQTELSQILSDYGIESVKLP